jgi:hypothetical protein
MRVVSHGAGVLEDAIALGYLVKSSRFHFVISRTIFWKQAVQTTHMRSTAKPSPVEMGRHDAALNSASANSRAHNRLNFDQMDASDHCIRDE